MALDWKEIALAIILTIVGTVAGLYIYNMYFHIGVLQQKIDSGELVANGLSPAVAATEEIPA